MAPLEAFYGRHYHSPVNWFESTEPRLHGTDFIQKALDLVKVIKDRLQTTQSRHRIYVDRRQQPLRFLVGDKVFLRVTPMKGVVRLGRRDKLSPRVAYIVCMHGVSNKFVTPRHRFSTSQILANMHQQVEDKMAFTFAEVRQHGGCIRGVPSAIAASLFSLGHERGSLTIFARSAFVMDPPHSQSVIRVIQSPRVEDCRGYVGSELKVCGSLRLRSDATGIASRANSKSANILIDNGLSQSPPNHKKNLERDLFVPNEIVDDVLVLFLSDKFPGR
ncbi:hypothetical protein MTR67_051631 [Solanum verrucosum]|uniref:Uncharacterized protein n=1 Tax=Solanum verrucosum TaxID=315347 RepID=A0AAF1A0A9_SOLVR|nr:hypothetical protein MTR67_051631 [Solanum verrucosum]